MISRAVLATWCLLLLEPQLIDSQSFLWWTPVLFDICWGFRGFGMFCVLASTSGFGGCVNTIKILDISFYCFRTAIDVGKLLHYRFGWQILTSGFPEQSSTRGNIPNCFVKTFENLKHESLLDTGQYLAQPLSHVTCSVCFSYQFN